MRKNKKFHVYVINGPNINLLGTREVDIYGSKTIKQIELWTKNKLKNTPITTTWFQSNSESEIINYLHKLKSKADVSGIIINPAGLSHTSVVFLDALLAINSLPIVEVHLTNPCQREEFRRHLLTAKAATMIMCGLGFQVYYFALMALLERSSE